MKFGRFDSFADFISSYETEVQRREHALEDGMPVEERAARRREAREMAEVKAAIREFADEQARNERHYQLITMLSGIIETDTAVASDVRRCLEGNERVFVAIRYGDRMGITEPIAGLAVGATLHMRGEWIPREQAYAHGGEQLSVLHFTHHPIGFVCTSERCYE